MSQQAFDSELISLADAYEYLGQTATAESDGNLERLIGHVSAAISSYCGRKFLLARHTQVLNGTSTSTLYLPQWPATIGVAGVGDPGDEDAEGIWTNTDGIFGSSALLTARDGVVTDWDYYLPVGEDSRGAVHHRRQWPCTPGSVKVIWTAGYAQGSIPEPIALACKRWVATAFKVAERGLHAIQSEAVPGGSGTVTVFEQKMPADVKELLAPFKTRVLP